MELLVFQQILFDDQAFQEDVCPASQYSKHPLCSSQIAGLTLKRRNKSSIECKINEKYMSCCFPLLCCTHHCSLCFPTFWAMPVSISSLSCAVSNLLKKISLNRNTHLHFLLILDPLANSPNCSL